MMTSTTCGSEPIVSMKRSPPSPDDPSSLLGFGYPKLTLPLHHHQPFLRRCISDPYSPPPPPQTNPFLSAGHSPDLNPPQTNSPSPTHFNSSLPPRAPPQPPTFRRSVSGLNPSPAQAFSRSSSSNEMSLETDAADTPNSKRLKRMKGRLKEMSEWCRQLMQEEDMEQGDEELENGATQDIPDIDAIRDIPNDTSTEDSSEKEFSESVSVEKKDDSLVIHFRCHCDKAYQFLLNGSDCYYKLL